MKPLDGLVVVEVAGSMAGAYCTKMFVDAGATVTVVGDGTLDDHQRAYLHTGTTRSASLADIDLRSVDVLIESAAPHPLSPAAIEGHDRLVRVQISPFGRRGERAQWSSTDLTDYAASGHAYLYGDPEREPLQGPPDQPAVASGLFGFIGAMAALLARDRLGRGQTVDVSHVQVMVALHQVTLLRWTLGGRLLRRMGNRYTGQGQPNGPYRCRDGWVSIVGVTEPQVEGLLAVTGLLDLLADPRIGSPLDLQHHPELLDEPLGEWLAEHDTAEVVDLFQAMRIPTAPLLDPLELLADPQLVARGFFRPLPEDPSISIPGPPFTLSHEQSRGSGAWQPGDIADGPLAGLRVLDLARVWAGPFCARLLSDLGADVVWVEAPWGRGPRHVPESVVDATGYFPENRGGDEPWNRNGHMVKYSLGKQSVALDMTTTAGQDAFARLAAQAHVVLENFSPRVMPQFGFDECRLHELNPDLIYLTMPGYGRTGPAENWLAYGSCVDSHAGLSSLIGYPDASPWKGGVAWPDPIAGLHATCAVLSVLWSGQTSGTGGVTIEGAQFESTVAAIGDQIVRAQIDGPFVPVGNRNAEYVAQGVYPCAGDDRWIAISMPDRPTFDAACDVLGLPTGAAAGAAGGDAEPGGPEHDRFDHDTFDAAVASLTGACDADDLAVRLQAAGVPAAAVTTAPDLLADAHFRSVDAWLTVEQPQVGTFTTAATPLWLSATPPRRPTPAPLLGEHNRQVLAAAGFSADEITSLASDGVLVDRPPA